VSSERKKDSLAEELDRTRWEYSQSEDRRFLLDPIGKFFGTFRWDDEKSDPANAPTPDDESGQPG
jgi:hypothetical protein